MSIVNAKCTNCGASLRVNSKKDAAICEYCGSAFVVEKAINKYNIEQLSINVNKNSDLESLRILAYAAVRDEELDKAAQLFYELFTNDHTDILSKYLYQLTEALIPLSSKEKAILENVDHPSYDEIDDKKANKDKKGEQVAVELTQYCIDKDIFNNPSEITEVVVILLKEQYGYHSSIATMEDFLEKVYQNHKTNAAIKELAHFIAERLFAECRASVDWLKWNLSRSKTKEAADNYMDRCLKQTEYARKIAGYFDDVAVPEELLQLSREELLKSAQHPAEDGQGWPSILRKVGRVISKIKKAGTQD